jgi:glutamyl-tRNA reductase
MNIVMIGVDHTGAPIALRERLACSNGQVSSILSAAQLVTQESVLLSTCNRIELYAVCADAKNPRELLLHLLSQTRQVAEEELEAYCYYLHDEEAIVHLFGVACGLYSLVPGEVQIQGQVADALEIAQKEGYAGPVLSALFRAALGAGKRARSETGISRNAASVSHVAVQLARHLFPQFAEACVLLVGSGQMSELAARNLRDNGAQRLVIINRTHEHAAQMAAALGATHRTFAELAEALLDADIVISSTTSPYALITYEMMQRVIERRSGRSLLLIDIALPRDIEPAVATLPGIHLYNLDDLHTEVERGIQLRLQETEQVQRIIAEEAKDFKRWLASLSVVGTITDLRHHAELLRQQEFERAMRHLSSSLSERETAAIQELTTRFMNKLLHTPMLRLKDAAASGHGHMYAEALRYLFDLEEKDEASYRRDASQQARYDTNTVDYHTATSAVAGS